MNLRNIANRSTQRINPNLPATVTKNLGYSTSASGHRTPTFGAPIAVIVQFQALTKKEVEHLDALNVAGTEMAAYVDMQLSSPDRTTSGGGDFITFGTTATIPIELRGTQWWVTFVLEGWTTAGWCKVGLTRQMPS